MRTGIRSLTGLVFLHLAVFAFAGACGGLWRAGPPTPPVPGAFFDEAYRLAAHNLGALALLVVSGVLFAGIVGVAMFALNGFLFGRMLVSSDAPIWGLWLYVPVELLSFALGAAGSMQVGFQVMAWLFREEPMGKATLSRPAAAITLAVPGLALAACLEAFAIQRVWGI